LPTLSLAGFGKGALGFFAVPYTILVYPILYLVFPRFWLIARPRQQT
jgi:SSS family solute:Na+ symporter